jgi:hypothetical protein
VVTTRVLARRERESISVHETTDRGLLKAFLETDRLFSAYALCDLDDREFLRTRWGVATCGGRPVAVVLQYAGYSPQPIFVMGENAGIEAILKNVIKPRAAYVAAQLENLPAVAAVYRVEPGPQMVRMWVRSSQFQAIPGVGQPPAPGRDRRAESALPARIRLLVAGQRHRGWLVLRHPRPGAGSFRPQARTSSARPLGWRSLATS